MADLPAALRANREPCERCRKEDPEEKKREKTRNEEIYDRLTFIFSSCCYEETLKNAWEYYDLDYRDDGDALHHSPTLITRMAKDLTLTSARSVFLHNEAVKLYKRVGNLELQLQVLLDMKRMGEIDAGNGSLKKKRRDSV